MINALRRFTRTSLSREEEGKNHYEKQTNSRLSNVDRRRISLQTCGDDIELLFGEYMTEVCLGRDSVNRNTVDTSYPAVTDTDTAT